MTIGEGFDGVLEAAKGGAEWAWTSLYRDLAPLVLGYLRSRGAPDPEDLNGEVFLQIARDLRSFTGSETEFRSWVLVIAHHRLLDESRARSRRPSEPSPPELLVERGASGNVEEEALRGLATHRVRQLLSVVTEEQAEVLMLRILGGLTVDEVARLVGKRPNSVKALQRRGLATVKKALAKEVATL